MQQALGDIDWASDGDGKENQGGGASRAGLYASLRPDQEERVEAILAQVSRRFCPLCTQQYVFIIWAVLWSWHACVRVSHV